MLKGNIRILMMMKKKVKKSKSIVKKRGLKERKKRGKVKRK